MTHIIDKDVPTLIIQPYPILYSKTMRTKSKYSKADNNAFWNRNGSRSKKATSSKQFPVTEFLQETYRKVEERVLGPGGGFGIGCGAGVGLGFVGGIGYGGWPWNHLRLVFGVGIGCGVGLGLGFGQGFGYGFSLDSLQSNMSKNRSDSGRRFAIDF